MVAYPISRHQLKKTTMLMRLSLPLPKPLLPTRMIRTCMLFSLCFSSNILSIISVSCLNAQKQQSTYRICSSYTVLFGYCRYFQGIPAVVPENEPKGGGCACWTVDLKILLPSFLIHLLVIHSRLVYSSWELQNDKACRSNLFSHSIMY